MQARAGLAVQMSDAQFVCVSQRAGPYVKAFVTDRQAFLHRNRGDSPNAIRKRCGPAMSRTTVDKLELRLALFGYDGVFYTLTFADEYLPQKLEGVQKVWECFIKRLKRWHKKLDKGALKFYVYRIEGRHGDHRWHIHCFLRDQDFPPAVVRYLWTWGEAYDVPYDYKRIHKEGGYWNLARYFTKEVPEVGRHAWGASHALSAMIPAPQVSFTKTGRINVPREAVRLPVRDPGITEWGVFNYARYLTS